MTIGLSGFRDERIADRLRRMLLLPITGCSGDYGSAKGQRLLDKVSYARVRWKVAVAQRVKTTVMLFHRAVFDHQINAFFAHLVDLPPRRLHRIQKLKVSHVLRRRSPGRLRVTLDEPTSRIRS